MTKNDERLKGLAPDTIKDGASAFEGVCNSPVGQGYSYLCMKRVELRNELAKVEAEIIRMLEKAAKEIEEEEIQNAEIEED